MIYAIRHFKPALIKTVLHLIQEKKHVDKWFHTYMTAWYMIETYIKTGAKLLLFNRLSPIGCVTFRQSNKIRFVKTLSLLCPNPPGSLSSFLCMPPECLCISISLLGSQVLTLTSWSCFAFFTSSLNYQNYRSGYLSLEAETKTSVLLQILPTGRIFLHFCLSKMSKKRLHIWVVPTYRSEPPVNKTHIFSSSNNWLWETLHEAMVGGVGRGKVMQQEVSWRNWAVSSCGLTGVSGPVQLLWTAGMHAQIYSLVDQTTPCSWQAAQPMCFLDVQSLQRPSSNPKAVSQEECLSRVCQDFTPKP